ncbi:TGS domain-containing protein, partial [Staphylococcus aureus]|nr:TGS domain-containing protein [Staphylococcus aureus]
PGAGVGVGGPWPYKTHRCESRPTAQHRAQGCGQSLLELQQSAGSSFEFIESVKSDLFPDEIYVFTPEGRIVELPAGATPVDFAYAVHTDIGHACVGARVDRQPYPLSQPLSRGQTVEIITAPAPRPHAARPNVVRRPKDPAPNGDAQRKLPPPDRGTLARAAPQNGAGGGRQPRRHP